MSKSASLCIVNNYVHLSANLTKSDIKDMKDYMAREGRFKERGGLDASETRSDQRLRSLDGLGEIEKMEAYYSRTGYFEGRGPENPLTPGERSGYCFDRDGTYDHTKLVEEIRKSGSNVITSVVSVRREDAAALHMDSKEAFERLLRGHWDDTVASWGLIEPKDIRWVAYYHVDGVSSLHCHVITIDASGRYGGEDRRLIPTDLMRKSEIRMNEVVGHPYIDRLDREKAYLRDAVCERIREHLGRDADSARRESLDRKREGCGSHLDHFVTRPLDAEQSARLIRDVTDVAPGGIVTQYKRSSEEVREAAKTVVETLREKDPILNEMFRRHERVALELGETHGRMDRFRIDEDGVADNELRGYVARERYDLQLRAASAVCSQARAASLPWKDKAQNDRVREAAADIRRAVRDGKGEDERRELRERYAEAVLREVREDGSQAFKEYREKRAKDEALRIERRATSSQEHYREAARMGRLAREDALSAMRAILANGDRNSGRVEEIPRDRAEAVYEEWLAGRRCFDRNDYNGAREHAEIAARSLLGDSSVRGRIDQEAHERFEANPRKGLDAHRDEAEGRVRDFVATAMEREYERDGAHARWAAEADSERFGSSLGSLLASALAGRSHADAPSSGSRGRAFRGSSKSRAGGHISRDLDSSRDAMRGR